MNQWNHQKLRIGFLGHKRVPSKEGGVEVVVEELYSRMAALGYEVTGYNRRGHHVSGAEFGGEQGLAEYKGIRLKSVPTIYRRGLAAMSASFFAALAAAFGKFDIVHFHAEGPCAMLWIPKLFGKRCIVTVHGLDWARSKWGGFASRYIKFGERVAVRFADAIIVLSADAQKYFMDTYGRETVVIPNGVNRPDLCSAQMIKAQFDLEKDSYILFLGRIVPEKGLRYLLEAYRKLHTDKKLVIAGGASDTAAFQQEMQALAAGNPNIIFTGFVQGQLLDELYSNAYIYTLPSDLEGMPLSLLEAMSYGNCCVVSDIPACTEVVEDMAVTFRKGDVSDLAEKLQLLCDDAEKVAAYKAAAADFICGKYHWDDVTARTLSIYESVSHLSFTMPERNKGL